VYTSPLSHDGGHWRYGYHRGSVVKYICTFVGKTYFTLHAAMMVTIALWLPSWLSGEVYMSSLQSSWVFYPYSSFFSFYTSILLSLLFYSFCSLFCSLYL